MNTLFSVMCVNYREWILLKLVHPMIFILVSYQNGPMSDLERLELFEKLEKADGRILALEKQVR